jgi:pyruvate dehydrogenase E1 component alpha subunit|tara:strand:+ start:1713 stop:2705 length:993 start_codon:yes stop_codon:yes gene_type:complete
MTVTVNLEKQQAIDLYSKMLLIRRFEEESERLYRRGMIRGFLHTYIGEEAIAAGAVPLLRTDDYVISHYRDHGHALARGMDPKTAMAELCGKSTGSSGGKGGSMHLFDAEKHFMGGHAIVGGQLPLAVGMALGIKQKGLDSVVMCFFGDGAVNEGEFHEAMNLASLWKLPVIFMLENNLYGMGTDVNRSRAGGANIYGAADPYLIPAVQIDGMDIMAVIETVGEGIQKVREKDHGPVFIECMAYRFHGHSMADPSNYRENEEVKEQMGRDPIDKFRALCLESNILSQEDISELDEQVDATVQEAREFAENSPEPSESDLYSHIYADSEAS